MLEKGAVPAEITHQVFFLVLETGEGGVELGALVLHFLRDVLVLLVLGVFVYKVKGVFNVGYLGPDVFGLLPSARLSQR